MSQRTTIIFIIFIVTAIAAGIFSYFYRGYTNELVRGYAEEITTCGVITDEMTCLDKVYCEGIYASVDDGVSLEFRKCVRIPDAILAQQRAEQQLCENTGGTWHKNRFGVSCICKSGGAPVAFDKINGCLAQ